jgi:hypothetical protein
VTVDVSMKKMRAAKMVLTLAVAAIAMLVQAAPAQAAAGFAGGADIYPAYVGNDHTPVAIHFTGTGLTAAASYYTKVRFSVGPTPSGGTNRGFTWNPITPRWVQERETWLDFPQVTADAGGAVSAWVLAKFGDVSLAGPYYLLISLTATGSNNTLNSGNGAMVTVLDTTGAIAAATPGASVHDGVATGAAANALGEVRAASGGALLAQVRGEPNGCDDDANGLVDDEDYGPAGSTGDFRAVVPATTALTVAFDGVVWAIPASSSGPAGGDVALGAADQTPPAAPNGLTARPRAGMVQLAWSTVADAAEYQVESWTDPTPLGSATNYSSPHRVAGLPTVAPFADTGVTNDTVYHYCVRAVDSAGNMSPASATVTARPDEVPPVTTDDSDGLWHPGPVTVTLAAVDTGGLTPPVTYYRVNGHPKRWAAGTSVTLTPGQRWVVDGANRITYHSVDEAGNAETPHRCTVNLGTGPASRKRASQP